MTPRSGGLLPNVSLLIVVGLQPTVVVTHELAGLVYEDRRWRQLVSLKYPNPGGGAGKIYLGHHHATPQSLVGLNGNGLL